MHCEQAEMLLPQLIFDELDDASRTELMEHLSTCSACSEKLGDLRLTVNLLRQGVASRPPVLSAARRAALLKQLADGPVQLHAEAPAPDAALASLAASAQAVPSQVAPAEVSVPQDSATAPLKFKANPDRVNPASFVDGPIPIWNWIRRHQRGLAIAAASLSIAVISWQTFSSVFQGVERSVAMSRGDYTGYKDKAAAPVKGFDENRSWDLTPAPDSAARQAESTPNDATLSYGFTSGSNAINGAAADPQNQPGSLALGPGNSTATEYDVELHRVETRSRYSNEQLAATDDSPRELGRRWDRPRVLVTDGEAGLGDKSGVAIDAIEPLAQAGRRLNEGIERDAGTVTSKADDQSARKDAAPAGGDGYKRGFGTANAPVPAPFRNDNFYSHNSAAPSSGPVPTSPSTPPPTPVVTGKPMSEFSRNESAPTPPSNRPADPSTVSGVALADSSKVLGGKQSGLAGSGGGSAARPDGLFMGEEVKNAELKSKLAESPARPIVPSTGQPAANGERFDRGERDEMMFGARVQPLPKVPALETPAQQGQGIAGRTYDGAAPGRDSAFAGGGAVAGVPVPAKPGFRQPAGPQQPAEPDGTAVVEKEKKRELTELQKDMKKLEPQFSRGDLADQDDFRRLKEDARSAGDGKPGSSAGDALAVAGAKKPEVNTWFDRGVDFDSDQSAKGDRSEGQYWSFQSKAGQKQQSGEVSNKPRSSTALGVELDMSQDLAQREKLDDKAKDRFGDRPVEAPAAEPELLRRAHLDISGGLPDNETLRATLGREAKGEEKKDSTIARLDNLEKKLVEDELADERAQSAKPRAGLVTVIAAQQATVLENDTKENAAKDGGKVAELTEKLAKLKELRDYHSYERRRSAEHPANKDLDRRIDETQKELAKFTGLTAGVESQQAINSQAAIAEHQALVAKAQKMAEERNYLGAQESLQQAQAVINRSAEVLGAADYAKLRDQTSQQIVDVVKQRESVAFRTIDKQEQEDDPGNPAAEAMKTMTEDSQLAVKSKENMRLRSLKVAKQQVGLIEATIPYNELITDPSDWPQITASRVGSLERENADTELNRRIADKLKNPLPANFEGNKLVNVVDYFRNTTGVNYFVNWYALEAAGVEQNLPITLKLDKSLPAEQSLRLVLEQAGAASRSGKLGYSIIDGVVHISTHRDLQRTSDTKVYDLAGLIPPIKDGATEAAMRAREAAVMELATKIQSQVGEPGEWAERGGDVSSLRELNGNLIVKTTLEQHLAVTALLAKLRGEAPGDQAGAKEKEEDSAELMPAASFKVVPVNPWTLAQEDNQSTFGLDVDTASYSLARRYLKRGYLPPVGSVRMEEFVNAFDYNYPTRGEGVFTVHTEAAPAPFAGDSAGNTVLLKVGVKGKVIGRDGRKPANLVLVIDASGSMSRADRLPLVQHSLTLLVSQLNPSDTVSIVAFGSQVHTLLQTTPASQKSKIIEAIASIQPTGQTNLLKGLQAGYQLAEQAHKAGAINRVILCSDGIATVGESEAEAILSYVDRYRQQGIACTTVGFGAGAYDDNMMEKLANKGDGAYYFVDSQREARRVFVDELTATLQTIAKDAKIQVEFNPAKVRRYRLIGYENRAIADKDFRNDKIDAGEVGSGQSSTALYELELIDAAQPVDHGPQAGPVQAAQPNRPAPPTAPAANTPGPQVMNASDLGIVYVRYRNTDTDKIEEIAQHVGASLVKRCTPGEAPRLYLAACAAEFAEILRQSEHAKDGSLQQLTSTLERVVNQLPLDEKAAELLDLVRKAQGLPRAP